MRPGEVRQRERVKMQAFMFPQTARSLLAQSRAFTAAKRAQREEQRAIVQTQKQFERIGWKPEAAYELAVLHIRMNSQ